MKFSIIFFFLLFGNGAILSQTNQLEVSVNFTEQGKSAIYGLAENDMGVDNSFFTYGVFGQSLAPNGKGVTGLGNTGVTGTGGFVGLYGSSGVDQGRAVWGDAQDNATRFAGFFSGKVRVEGNFEYTGTITGPVSDKRFKNILKSGDSFVDPLRKIKVEKYSYKTAEYRGMALSPGIHFGYIAQELEEVYPHLVHSSNYSNHSENLNETLEEFEYKTINYLGMIPILTGAIQEQQKIIEQQASLLNTLHQKLQNVEKLISKLSTSDIITADK